MDAVKMTHHRLGTREVSKLVVKKMQQNGWKLEGAPAKAAPSKTEQDKEGK